mgnify:FL=1
MVRQLQPKYSATFLNEPFGKEPSLSMPVSMKYALCRSFSDNSLFFFIGVEGSAGCSDIFGPTALKPE